MQQVDTQDRWQEIRQIWIAKENQWLYALVGFAVGVLLTPFLASKADVLSNLFPEAVGILFTVIVIDQLNERRDERRRVDNLKEQLIRNAGSMSNEIAKNAIYELTRHGWLFGQDGVLISANLRGANLSSANLFAANLSRVDLRGANLENAILANATLKMSELQETNLIGANLVRVILSGSILYRANLTNAHLSGSNLANVSFRDAKLVSTDLRDTSLDSTFLYDADLSNADFRRARLYETTILPDGSHWIPDTDMTRFTDPSHPNFWRSDNPLSPAYRGKQAHLANPATAEPRQAEEEQ